MKTTVKTSSGDSVRVEPWQGGKVMLQMREDGEGPHCATTFMTPDQCGALIFGIEQALEAQGVAKERAGA